MKPTVISNANTGPANLQAGESSVSIPINQEFRGSTNSQQQHQQPQFHTQGQYRMAGSPDSMARGQRQQLPHSHRPQNTSGHFQDFDFEPDDDLDMFPRTRLGRMSHDPFGDFGSTSHFGFPQFNSLGRRRINPRSDEDFFNRLPSEFRQYIPESFAHRQQSTTQQQPQQHTYNTMPPTTSRNVCDAAIQTEDPTRRSEVDHAVNSENLHHHGLRNTMDMGVKSHAEKENQSPRSASAPPTEQQQNMQQTMYTQPQDIPPQQHNQFATQTSPQLQSGGGGYGAQSPQFQNVFYGSQHPQSQARQQTPPPPPQTPGGSNIRTIPIFVEGRADPIINDKEIPNQSVPAADNSATSTPANQQSRRLPPLNTQQQSATTSGNLPPQTPHTVDTINKIQNIQRDVLDLMSRVENFTGTRADKEYVYLDEMLTRNLLKLDNIETNGKDSIRLARKEAIKCIQASINVLEAKAEENKKANQSKHAVEEPSVEMKVIPAAATSSNETQKSTSNEKITKETQQTEAVELFVEPGTGNKNEAIPLPPPASEKFNEVKIEDCPDDDIQAICASDSSKAKADDDTSENVSA